MVSEIMSGSLAGLLLLSSSKVNHSNDISYFCQQHNKEGVVTVPSAFKSACSISMKLNLVFVHFTAHVICSAALILLSLKCCLSGPDDLFKWDVIFFGHICF